MTRTPAFKFSSRKSPRRYPEAELQTTVVQHLLLAGVPGIVWFHVPNEGKRSVKTGAYLKRLGVKAGVADLILFRAGRAYCLELKAKGGKPGETQIAFAADCLLAGVPCEMADNIDDALAVLHRWGMLGGRAETRRAAA